MSGRTEQVMVNKEKKKNKLFRISSRAERSRLTLSNSAHVDTLQWKFNLQYDWSKLEYSV